MHTHSLLEVKKIVHIDYVINFLDEIPLYYFNFLQWGEFQSRLNTSTNSVRKSCLGTCPASFSVDSKANPIPAVLV